MEDMYTYERRRSDSPSWLWTMISPLNEYVNERVLRPRQLVSGGVSVSGGGRPTGRDGSPAPPAPPTSTLCPPPTRRWLCTSGPRRRTTASSSLSVRGEFPHDHLPLAMIRFSKSTPR